MPVSLKFVAMRSVLRPANVGLILSYLLLSAPPYFPLLLGRPVHDAWQIAGVELLGWLTIWSLFKRPAYFHWLLAPAFFALPVQLYLNIYFGQGISPHHLGIIAETSPKEALEFLGSQIWLLGAVVVAVVVWFFATWRLAHENQSLDWDGRSRWIVLLLMAALGGSVAYGTEVGVASDSSDSAASATAAVSSHQESKGSGSEDSARVSITRIAASAGSIDAEVSSRTLWSSVASMPKLPAWAVLPVSLQTFGASWPFGLSVPGYQFWKEREYLSHLSDESKRFTFHASQTSESDTPQVIVMVIGESSRYDRWSINGYKRDTTPLLRGEKNLVPLADLITSVSATRLSVPVIMSRKPATESLRAGFAEKSFISAFKEAGFKTWWLSNQMSFGQFDTPISVFAKEADVTQFVNLGGFTDSSTLDQVLLDPLRIALSDPSKKKLIVLHTLGNHWNYSHRYPQKFDKWKPSLFGISDPAYTDLKLKIPLNNSYDNSILYTDWFLSQVIAQLKDSHELSSLFYVADHGQTLYDGTCRLAFHGHNTQFEFHVPAFFWYSDRYLSTWPDKIATLRRHQRARLSTENVFHSLLDMEDVHYPDEHLDRSIFSTSFKTHKRYVDSYGWTDYDNARMKGDCREVIAKGRPLPQEP